MAVKFNKDLGSKTQNWVSENWASLLLAQTLLLEVAMVVPNYLSLKRPAMWKEAMLFAYSGWSWAWRGRSPYLYVWDVKPPGIHELSALLSLLSLGNPHIHAVLNTLASVAAISGIIMLVGLLVFEFTQNSLAAYAAGTLPLAMPMFYQLPANGLRPKFFVLAFGLLALYWSLYDKWLRSGAVAALAASFWQLGIIFPILVGAAAVRKQKASAKQAFAGMAAATVAVLLPVVIAGPLVFESMLVQVLLSPFLTSESAAIGQRLTKAIGLLGPATPAVALGVAGTALSRHYKGSWWVAGLAGWYTIQVLVLDLDGAPDLFPILIAASLGFGLLLDRVSNETLGVLLVAFVALVMFYQTGAFASAQAPVGWGYNDGSFAWHYWEQQSSDTCHIRLSSMEKQFVESVGGSLDASKCNYDFRSILRQII